jgi:hypothetical protein
LTNIDNEFNCYSILMSFIAIFPSIGYGHSNSSSYARFYCIYRMCWKCCIIRPMKIDIMFLVPARMGFICRKKIFHYSLFLKNRLNTKLISRSKSYCCIPQAQLKLYLSKDITRHAECLYFSCQPWYGMRRSKYTVE